MLYKLQPREKIMLAILALACLCFVLFKYLLIPQFSKYGENRDKLNDLQSKVKVAEAVVRSQKKETELAAQVTRQLDELKPLFNNVMGDGLAIVHIGLKAVESNVQIVSFVPADIIDKGIYLELPAHFEVRGDYCNVSEFISEIEDLPDLSELRTLEIKPYEGIKTVQAAAPAEVAAPGSQQGPAMEVVPPQDGTVVAAFDLVTFTSPSPEARLQIEQVLSWAVGRYNAFLSPVPVSPYPGVKPAVQNLNPFIMPLAIDEQEADTPQKVEGSNNVFDQVAGGVEVSKTGSEQVLGEGEDNSTGQVWKGDDINAVNSDGTTDETAGESNSGGNGSAATGSKIARQAGVSSNPAP